MLTLLLSISWIIVIYFVIANVFYIIFYLCSAVVVFNRQEMINSIELEMFYQSMDLPEIAFIVPVFNEENSIIFTTESLLELPYPEKTIIIVNDGSSDLTFPLLLETFHLDPIESAYSGMIPTEPVSGVHCSQTHPNLFVINKANGGRSDAINAGLNLCDKDFFITLDADTLIEPIELTRLIRYMITKPEVRGFSASIRIVNGCEMILKGLRKANIPTNWLAACQSVEYLRAFLIGRTGWTWFGGSLILSGAFSFYERQTIVSLGGFDSHTIGEDMEMTLRLKTSMMDQKQNSTTEFIPTPVCWTEVPSTFRELSKQRIRWAIGLCQCLSKYRHCLFNPRYGWLGMVQLPFYFFYELGSAFVELLGYVILILIYFYSLDFTLAFLFILVSIGFTTALNCACVLIEVTAFRKYDDSRNVLLLLFYSLFENIGYRQLNLIWRLIGQYRYFTGQTQWGVVKKKGFKKL